MIQYKITSREQIPGFFTWIKEMILGAIGKRKWILVTLESDMTRSLDQNSKIHAMIEDVRRDARGLIGTTYVNMEMFDEEGVKTLLVKWFLFEKVESGEKLPRRIQPKIIIDPLYGDAVYCRPSTTDFGKKIMCEFIEFIYAIGSTLGVNWSEQSQEVYGGRNEG